MHRLVVLAWEKHDPRGHEASRRLQRAAATDTPLWETVFSADDTLVLHSRTNPLVERAYMLWPDGGVVIGTLFARSTVQPGNLKQGFDEDVSRQLLQSGGGRLVEQYWGHYVAVLRDPRTDTRFVLRDPTANFPCFHVFRDGLHVFFSDVADLVKLFPVPLSVDWTYLRAHAFADEQLTRSCGLAEVDDVPGGECMELRGGRVLRRWLWHPADFCAPGEERSLDRMALELRQSVQETVSAWAACFDRVCHRLSGGLDSSIVAGCLAEAPSRPAVTCLNFYTGATDQDERLTAPGLAPADLAKLRRMAGHSDERRYARIVAERWGFPLLEHERRVDAIDLRRIQGAPLAVRPSRYVQALDMDEQEIEVARTSLSQAFFSGLGGDTVFYTTFQPTGAIDYAYRRHIGRRLIREIVDASRLSNESVWEVTGKALRYGILRRPMPPVWSPLGQPHLLDDGVVRDVRLDDLLHPWLLNPLRLCPGKLNHVRAIASSGSVMFYPYVFHRERYATSINPLAEQPVVEASLRTPTYSLLAGGVSRGLARYAFSDLLPREVARRTVKGLPTTLFQQVLRRNMRFLREYLLDGLLVREGILDRGKLAAYLVEDQPFLTVQPAQIIYYLTCEAWLDQWRSILASSSTQAH